MKSFADLKANARSALLGRYSVLIGAGILAWLIAALIEIPFSRMLQEDLLYPHIPDYLGLCRHAVCRPDRIAVQYWHHSHAYGISQRHPSTVFRSSVSISKPTGQVYRL